MATEAGMELLDDALKIVVKRGSKLFQKTFSTDVS
jgi:hypothetical protein